MLLRLLLLFLVVPLVELTLLLILGDVTDRWWVPILLVIVTGVVGAGLARRQGLQTLRRIQAELSQGKLPTDALLDALLIFLAGALLLTPGVLTDAVGVSLLIPPCRRFYKARLVAWLKTHFQLHVFPQGDQFGSDRSTVIDSYVVDPSDDQQRGPP